MSSSQPQILLSWANKHVPAPPVPAAVTLCEMFSPLGGAQNRSVEGSAVDDVDNLGVLAHLLATGWAGRFRLIYADPPYNSGVDWAWRVRRRGPNAVQCRRPALEQQPQYADAWDESAYLQFLYARAAPAA